jgi:pyridoxine kinase
MPTSSECRVLSIQSHVVSGYVGNKSATFPLQLLGYEVDSINSVQFSNHTGYAKGIRGQILDDAELWDLFEGLLENGIADGYSHVINGYIGSASFLKKLAEVVKKAKELNPNLTYVCDPVMGDFGPGMYVDESLLPIYRDVIVPLADVCVPNQFEAELITGMKIKDEGDAFEAMDYFHGLGVETVILSSTELDVNRLVALAR